MKNLLLPLIFWFSLTISWVINLFKLFLCFTSGYYWEEKIIHGIGLIPGISMITCWF